MILLKRMKIVSSLLISDLLGLIQSLLELLKLYKEDSDLLNWYKDLYDIMLKKIYKYKTCILNTLKSLDLCKNKIQELDGVK